MIKLEKEKEVELNLIKYKKITNIISITRLILALIVIVFVICLFSLNEYILYSILSLLSFIILIIFILLTNKYYSIYNLYIKKKKVYESHHKRRNLDLSLFHDTGAEFINKDDYKISDLDLFGKNSLFQYLNVAKSYHGRKLLAKQLTDPDVKSKDFTTSVNYFASNEDSLEIEASLLRFNDSAFGIRSEDIISILNSKIKFKPIFILPLMSFILMIAYLFLIIFLNFPIPYISIFFLTNLALSLLCYKNDVFYAPSTKYHTMLLAYKELVETILKLDIKDIYVNKFIDEIKPELLSLNDSIKLFSLLSMRNNIIFKILFNALCIFDFISILSFNHLVNKNYNLNLIFKNTAIIECIISLAIAGLDNETYTIPTSSDFIEFEELTHPLVKNCVSNSLKMEKGIILTGSNMSGKTTFMRTVGINQVLYMAGGIVLAKMYKAPRCHIYTSLRCNDMLNEGVSTFYAEILRMKLMNKKIKEEKALLLVDEIFKGTNQEERLEASFKVIDLFNKYNASFIISTHDNQLCSSNNILNYHFNEEYNNDKISFDYKIKSGICESKNAMYLLKLAEIL